MVYFNLCLYAHAGDFSVLKRYFLLKESVYAYNPPCMDKILISACLLGDKTKYDGGDNYLPFIEKLKKKYELVPFCPEMEGGLGCPRSPSEIQKDGSVKNSEGKDVSSSFAKGAEKAYQACRFFGIGIAILKDGSPSCGSRYVYDGSFKGNKVEGLGITARRLIAAGIRVYSSEDNLDFLLGETEEEYEKRKQANIEKVKARKEAEELRKAEKEAKKAENSENESEHKKYERKPRSFDRKRSFHKDDGEYSSRPRRSYKKDGVHSFHKDGERSFHRDGEHRSYRKDGERRSFHRDDTRREFAHHDERRPFTRNDGYKKDGYRKDGFKKRDSFGKKPYGERRNDEGYERKPFKKYGERKPFSKDGYHKDGERRSYRKDGERRSFDKGHSERRYGPKKFGDKKFGEKKFGSKRYGDKKPYRAKKNED